MAHPFCEQISILSDDSDDEEITLGSKPLFSSAIDITSAGLVSEGMYADAVLRSAQMYQEYMKRVPIPMLRGSVVPFNCWTDLGESLKQLYKQPLHYLTNIWLKQLDEMRIGALDDDVPLDTIINPGKAEASIWLMEEVHRVSSSHCHLAKLWTEDKFYHIFIDHVIPELPKPSFH